MSTVSEFKTTLENGKPRYVTLNTKAIVKITKITIDDGEQDALYEILSTVPGAPNFINEDCHFIYKNIVNSRELEEFLIKYNFFSLV